MSVSKLPKFTKDRAYRRRGGSAEWLLLDCVSCKSNLAFYQKDGPGNILRLYLDRISDSDGDRPYKQTPFNQVRNLGCYACNALIGVPLLYDKDPQPRPAIRLVQPGVEKTAIRTVRQWNEVKEINLAITMASLIAGQSGKTTQ